MIVAIPDYFRILCVVTSYTHTHQFQGCNPWISCLLFTFITVLLPLFLILPEAASDPEEYLRDDHEQRDEDEEEGDHLRVPLRSVEQFGHPLGNRLKKARQILNSQLYVLANRWIEKDVRSIFFRKKCGLEYKRDMWVALKYVRMMDDSSFCIFSPPL